MTSIIGQTNTSIVVVVLLLWQTIAMLGSYLVAVLDGHVPPPPQVPMISDCGCRPYEMNVFQIGFIGTATLMSCCSWIMRAYIECCLRKQGKIGTFDFNLNNALVWEAYIGSICLAGLSSVNELENNSVHVSFTVVFFTGNIFYMIGVVYLLSNNVGVVTNRSLLIKKLIIYGILLDLVFFGYFALFDYPKTPQAICEWLAVIGFMLFYSSFYAEFKKGYYVAVVDEPPSNFSKEGFALNSIRNAMDDL